MESLVVGIDLGTTFSAIAYVDDQYHPIIIPNAEGKNFTPSVVLVQNQKIAVGDVALNQWLTNEEHVARWIKRAIGDENYQFQEMTAIEISAEILKILKQDAECYLGSPISQAVITCPAYFNAIEIESTKKAGELAGLQVREVIKEPTAAAVYYGIENMNDGETLMVCDLGGGTYDATIIRLEQGTFQPVATKGDRLLGGHDWTMELVDLVSERFMEKTGEDPKDDLTTEQILYQSCEQGKRDFSRIQTVNITFHHRGQLHQFAITRDEFAAKTEWLIQKMIMSTEDALQKANLKWNNIDHILLVGGSSRLSRVTSALKEVSGKIPIHSNQPDLMVAYGAAILAKGKVRPRKQGGLIESAVGGLVEANYSRIIARSLGTRVVTWQNDQPSITNSLFIPHSTKVPETGLSHSQDHYEISCDNQESFYIPVVEFEDDEDYELFGNYQCQCLPNSSKGDKVKVTFHYDVSGIITVEALDLKRQRKLKLARKEYQEPNLNQLIKKNRYIVFVLDVSYSMESYDKIINAKAAIIDESRKLLTSANGNCKIGVVTFGSIAKVICPPTDHFSRIQEAVSVVHPDGSTAMHQGILKAMDLAFMAPLNTEQYIVLVTDGMPDDPQAALKSAQEIQSHNISLAILGIGQEDVDQCYLNQLTPISFTIDAENSKDIEKFISTLLTKSAEIHKQKGGLTDSK